MQQCGSAVAGRCNAVNLQHWLCPVYNTDHWSLSDWFSSHNVILLYRTQSICFAHLPGTYLGVCAWVRLSTPRRDGAQTPSAKVKLHPGEDQSHPRVYGGIMVQGPAD